MAFYHRSDLRNTNLKGVNQVQRLFTYSEKIKKSVFSAGWQDTGDVKEEDWPAKGVAYELVIEVCKDGSKHPKAWAMLPDIGGFRNWNQANSFALRIEWQISKGEWTCRYLHAYNIFSSFNQDIPGSYPTYIKGISFLQWLTNSVPNHNYPWIPRVQGCARVLQARYDFMKQTIKFGEASPIRMLSGQQLSLNQIRVLMNKPEYSLQNVDGTWKGSFELSKMRDVTNKCDCCALLPGGILLLIFDVNATRTRTIARHVNCTTIVVAVHILPTSPTSGQRNTAPTP